MSPYVDTTAGIPQSTMISLQQQQGLQSGSYYEASLQQMGMHGDPSMQHTTRAHPQTVSVCSFRLIDTICTWLGVQ